MALPLLEWVDSSVNRIGLQIHAAEMEVDCVGEALFVAEAPAAHLDHLEPAVNTFGRSIGHLQNDGIEDAPQMIPDGSGGLPDQFQTATHRPGQPPLPALACPGATDIMPLRHRRFLERPGSGGL